MSDIPGCQHAANTFHYFHDRSIEPENGWLSTSTSTFDNSVARLHADARKNVML